MLNKKESILNLIEEIYDNKYSSNLKNEEKGEEKKSNENNFPIFLTKFFIEKYKTQKNISTVFYYIIINFIS